MNLGVLSLKFVGDTRRLDGAFSKIQGKAAKFASIGKVGFLAVAAAAGLAAGAITKGVSAYDIQAKAEANLVTALKGRQDVQQRLIEQAANLQSQTLFGDEDTIQAQAFLAQLGLQEEAIIRLTPLIQDFAQAQGVKLTDAAKLVAKSVGSSTNALSRYGISIEGAVGSNERLESAVGALSTAFGGQAEAAAAADVKLTQARNKLGDILETVGEVFAPAIKEVNQGLVDTFTNVEGFFQSSKVQEFAIKAAAAIKAAFQTAGTEIKIEMLAAEELVLQFAKVFQKTATGLANSSLGKIIFPPEERIQSNSNLIEVLTRLNDVRGEIKLLEEGGNRFGDVYASAVEDITSRVNTMSGATSVFGGTSAAAWGKTVKGAEDAEKAYQAFLRSIHEIQRDEVQPAQGEAFLQAPTTGGIGGGISITDEQANAEIARIESIQQAYQAYLNERVSAEQAAIEAADLETQNALLEQQAANLASAAAAASTFGSKYREATAEGKKGLAAFASAAANTAREVISATIAQGVAKAAASALENVPFPLNIILAGVAAGAAKALFDSVIPSFHDGGRMPHDGLALLHQGEIITNPALGQRPPGGGVQRVNISGITSGPDWAWMNANAGQLGRLINGPG